jgi:hypothetical protein
VLPDEPFAINSVIWLWGLSVSLLLGTLLGVVWARWQHRQRDQRGHGGSMTDWGESLALVNELRREIRRLSQANARLQADRTESLAALARAASSLERGAGEVDPARAPGESLGTDRSPSRSAGA